MGWTARLRRRPSRIGARIHLVGLNGERSMRVRAHVEVCNVAGFRTKRVKGAAHLRDDEVRDRELRGESLERDVVLEGPVPKAKPRGLVRRKNRPVGRLGEELCWVHHAGQRAGGLGGEREYGER
jgi:hypothetical protein